MRQREWKRVAPVTYRVMQDIDAKAGGAPVPLAQHEVHGEAMLKHGNVGWAPTASQSARWISRPVTSSACTMRLALWPPSRVRCRVPSALRVNAAPISASSSTRGAASRHTTSTALWGVCLIGISSHVCAPWIVEVGASLEGVANVGVDAVIGIEHGAHAALGVLGAALVDLGLGDDGDAAVLGGFQGKGQASDAAADDQKVK